MTAKVWRFRSGWCAADALPWQHDRCVGAAGETPCVCECHQAQPPSGLADVVERYDVAGLVSALAGLAAQAGTAPPAVRRMLTAGRQLLDEADR